MIKKITVLTLAVFMLNLFFCTSAQASFMGKEEKRARKVKNKIVKLGTGEQTFVTVKLLDNTKLSGYISETGENNFTVTEKQTGKSTTVLYSQIKKASGKNYSTGEKILIGLGLFFAVAMIVGIALNDDF